MMIQWTWPDIHEGHLADMMQWIFESELDKFKLATPRLIDPHERRILEALFHKLDEHGVGSCAPEDIAGGEEETDDRKENIVDVETVKAVVGEDRVELLPFLELMCESGVRAHEGATEVLLADGRKLVLMKRAVGGQIWVFDGTPADEEQPRRVADVFEAEVLRWRALANEANANADARATEEATNETSPLGRHDGVGAAELRLDRLASEAAVREEHAEATAQQCFVTEAALREVRGDLQTFMEEQRVFCSFLDTEQRSYQELMRQEVNALCRLVDAAIRIGPDLQISTSLEGLDSFQPVASPKSGD
ncbi:unnamed protein product [Effrenium voratum]|nr:unnamed protein product [Effrenium voratum]